MVGQFCRYEELHHFRFHLPVDAHHQLFPAAVPLLSGVEVKFVLQLELLSSGPSEGRTGKPRFLRGVETRDARDEQMWAA